MNLEKMKNLPAHHIRFIRFAFFALIATTLWGIISFLIIIFLAQEITPPIYQAEVGPQTWIINCIATPLIENFLFIKALDAFADPQRLIASCLVGALLAAILHFSLRAIPALGLFFIIAFTYLHWENKSKAIGFWLGVFLHSLFNLPATIAAFSS